MKRRSRTAAEIVSRFGIAGLFCAIALGGGTGVAFAAGHPVATPLMRALALARAVKANHATIPAAGRAATPLRPLAPTGTSSCSTGWQVVNTPNPANAVFNGLDAVSATNVWGVGFSNPGGSGSPPDSTLAENYNGANWTQTPTPNPNPAGGTSSNDLNGVATIDATHVVAVGSSLFTATGSTSPTAITSFAGSLTTSTETGMTTVDQGQSVTELLGVAAADSTHLLVVGTYDDIAGVLQPLADPGTASTGFGSSQTFPTFNGDTALVSVAAVSATEFWAVGFTAANNNVGTPTQTLVEHFSGGSWAQVVSDNVGTGDNALNGVRIDSGGNIWAVGHSTSASGATQTLIEKYNGTKFAAITSPNPGTGNNELFGVAPINANSAWAVGQTSATTSNPIYGTLIEHWDGTSWTVVKSLDNGNFGEALSDVAAISQTDVWTGGGYVTSSNNILTLAAHECVLPPTITNVSPNSGPVTGGNTVVVTGTNMTTAGAVSYGTAPDTYFRTDSDTQLTTFAPSHAAGLVDVSVTNWGGTTTAQAADNYTFVPFVYSPPSPIAPDGSLTAGQTVNFAVKVEAPDGTPQANANVYLSFSGLGSATANGVPLTSTPVLNNTGAGASIALAYTAPTPLPTTTVPADAVIAQDAVPTPAETAQDTYTFSRSFYFAEGFTGCNFSESLSILTPKNSTNATINYYTKSMGALAPKSVAVTQGQVMVENVNGDVPANDEVSAKVTLPVPGVVERILHFINCGSWNGSTDVVGTTKPAEEWDFAEGSTLGPYSEFVTIQNPNLASAFTTLQYYTDAGGTPRKTLVLPPQSRTTIVVSNGSPINVDNCTPGAGGTCGVGPNIGGVSLRLTSDEPIIAERPFYVNNFSFGSGAIRDGHDAFGADAPANSWSFAEGNTLPGWNEYLTIQNPNPTPVLADLNYFTDKGAHPVKTVTLPATSRTTILVFAGNTTSSGACTAGAAGNCGVGPGVVGVSVTVVARGGAQIVAERPMYMVQNFGSGNVNGAHDGVGATALATLFGFSAVSTAPGDFDYLTILNSNATAANITLTYYTNAGSITKNFTVPANTRHTVVVYQAVNPGDNQHDGLGPGYSPVGIVLSSDQPVLVEKPTYSSNASTYGATNTVAFSPGSF